MKGKGFTILELLIVLSVIAILAVVIVPISTSIRQSAQTTLCASNQKQLYYSLAVYDQSNGRLPYGFDSALPFLGSDSNVYIGDASFDNSGLWWIQAISDSVSRKRDMSELWCPSNKFKGTKLHSNVLCGNYGVNRAICTDARGPESSPWVDTPLALANIQNPSQTLLLVDSGYSIISWRGASNLKSPLFTGNPNREEAFYIPGLSINIGRSFNEPFYNDAINGRHRGKTVNITHSDGHLESTNPDILKVEYRQESVNRSPLWSPR